MLSLVNSVVSWHLIAPTLHQLYQHVAFSAQTDHINLSQAHIRVPQKHLSPRQAAALAWRLTLLAAALARVLLEARTALTAWHGSSCYDAKKQGQSGNIKKTWHLGNLDTYFFSYNRATNHFQTNYISTYEPSVKPVGMVHLRHLRQRIETQT